MKKRRYIVPILLLFAVIMLFFGWYCKNVYPKTYLYYDGSYYSFLGAAVHFDSVGEEIGQIERKSLRTLWNKSGDSNNIPVGCKLYCPLQPDEAEKEHIFVGIPTSINGKEEIKYWYLIKEK